MDKEAIKNRVLSEARDRGQKALVLDGMELEKANLIQAIGVLTADSSIALGLEKLSQQAFTTRMKEIEKKPEYVLGYALGLGSLLENSSIPAFLTDADKNHLLLISLMTLLDNAKLSTQKVML